MLSHPILDVLHVAQEQVLIYRTKKPFHYSKETGSRTDIKGIT